MGFRNWKLQLWKATDFPRQERQEVLECCMAWFYSWILHATLDLSPDVCWFCWRRSTLQAQWVRLYPKHTLKLSLGYCKSWLDYLETFANYLLLQNPAHKDMISTIYLKHYITYRSPPFSLPNKAFQVLAGCKGLKHLTIHFDMHCNHSVKIHPANSSNHLKIYRISMPGEKLLTHRKWFVSRYLLKRM